MENTVRVSFDFSSNWLKGDKALEQEAINVVNLVKEDANEIARRLSKVEAYLTLEIGEWTTLYGEAKHAFSMGFFHSTIALVGMMSESFCRHLYQKVRIRRLDGSICENDNLFGDEKRIRQAQKIKTLKELLLIDNYVFEKLNYINKTRNKIVHDITKKVSEDVALKVLNSFIKVLDHRHQENYEFKDGKLTRKER